LNDWLNQPDSLNYNLMIFRQADRVGIIAAQGKQEEFCVAVELLEKMLSPRIDSKYREFLENWRKKYENALSEYKKRRAREGSRALEDFMREKIELALEKYGELMNLMDRVSILPPRGVGGLINAADYTENGIAEI